MPEIFSQPEPVGTEQNRLPAIWPLVLFLVLFLLALKYDRSIAVYLHESKWDAALKGSVLSRFMKFPGEWMAAGATLLAAYFCHKSRLNALVFAGVGLIVPLSNGLLKWGVGRHRPYRFQARSIEEAISWNCLPFRDGVIGLFKSTNLSFASGHACMAFALATMLSVLFPRFRVLFFIYATVTACERFLENAHWCSDAAAGAAMGYFGVLLISRLKFFRKWLSADCHRSTPAE